MTTVASDASPNRMEQRIPMALAVHLSGHQQIPGVETTFTKTSALAAPASCPRAAGKREIGWPLRFSPAIFAQTRA